VAKDNFESTFVGKVAHVVVNAGPGAYHRGPYDTDKETDPFRYVLGKTNELRQEDGEKVDLDEPREHEVHDAAYNGDVVHTEDLADLDVKEYGYGFWLRFLTCYPERLIKGKNAPWYIVSRLTKNPGTGDIGLGDRTLAIWQGQGYYQFATFNVKGQPNLVQNVEYGDIEGVWTFVYFSYSLVQK